MNFFLLPGLEIQTPRGISLILRRDSFQFWSLLLLFFSLFLRIWFICFYELNNFITKQCEVIKIWRLSQNNVTVKDRGTSTLMTSSFCTELCCEVSPVPPERASSQCVWCHSTPAPCTLMFCRPIISGEPQSVLD